jgi:predicted negative regulator of RcsB-dependent stress response
MEEEITIIDSNTRNEKIKIFFNNNKKKFLVGFSIIFIILLSYFTFEEIKKKKKIELANQFSLIKINFDTESKKTTIKKLTEIVNRNDTTYSPLALYYIIDNNLLDDKDEINNLFNKLINETKLQEEIKNLIIYKKGLFNSDFISENDLLQILNPIINSESIWRSHALQLLAEYFYSKNEKEKAKKIYKEIVSLKNVNSTILKESKKILNRELSE